MNNPDKPHDAAQAATTALIRLGHQPRPDPIVQLQEVAGQLTEHRHQAHQLLNLMRPGTAEHARQMLTVSDLFEQCTIALLPLVEAQLDGIEQKTLADAFGLDLPGGAA